MSKAVVFTPTCRYGGVDVNSNSLRRQTEQDFIWIVLDDLYYERKEMWDTFWPHHTIAGLPPKRKEGHIRNLAAAYNAAVDLAVKDFPEAKLFVTMQDYMWLPDDGLERLLGAHEHNPNYLLTGLCSISFDPTPDRVVNREGHYTVFAEPYYDKPQNIYWKDVRGDLGSGTRNGNHQEWEANWGAVPMKLLDAGLRWDEAYDRGVAYENQDLAIRAMDEFDSKVLVDLDNHAITLPHKQYFPEEEIRDAPLNNKEWHEKRWLDKGYVV